MSEPVFTASAKVAFMVGHPVAQTAMPGEINARAARLDLDVLMAPLDVRPDGLASFVETLRHAGNVAGAVVTAPHKAAMAGLLDAPSTRVQRSGQANLIWFEDGRLCGDNTDGQGFVRALQDNGFEHRNATCLIFGAGGAGAAIAAELAMSGASGVDLSDLDVTKAEAVASRLGGPVARLAPPETVAAYDLIVNASGVGLDGVSQVHPLTGLRNNAMVADVVAAPGLSPFLRSARAQGARIQTGREMSFAQIAIVARRFGWPESIAQSYEVT